MIYDLNQLSAGPEWAQYLIDNGWQMTQLMIGRFKDEATFIKGNDKIDYACSDQTGSTFIHSKLFIRSRWTEHNTVSGPDLEGDPVRFAFLCHAIGWVDLKEAKQLASKIAA
jgi:hypothetical protein